MRGYGFGLAMIGLGVSMIGGLVAYSVYESKQWDAFAAAHECQVTGKVAAHNAYGYHNGKYQYYWVPAKTVYKCNDGVEYTR